MSTESTDFERLYAADRDPWGLEGGWFEDRKRACVLAALPEPRYRRAFEPGCARGALSVGLAERCESLVCWDVAAAPVDDARARLAHHPHVRVDVGAVPGSWPKGTFDLIVVSELAYFLGAADRAALWRATRDALEPEGTLVVVDWQRPMPENPSTGAEVHAELADVPGFERLVDHREDDFRLEVLVRIPPVRRSVAVRTGLR